MPSFAVAAIQNLAVLLVSLYYLGKLLSEHLFIWSIKFNLCTQGILKPVCLLRRALHFSILTLHTTSFNNAFNSGSTLARKPVCKVRNLRIKKITNTRKGTKEHETFKHCSNLACLENYVNNSNIIQNEPRNIEMLCTVGLSGDERLLRQVDPRQAGNNDWLSNVFACYAL